MQGRTICRGDLKDEELGEGPIDMSPEEEPLEVRDQLLKELHDAFFEERMHSEDYDYTAEREPGTGVVVGVPVPMNKLLERAFPADQPSLLKLARQLRHGSRVNLMIDYRGCGCLFVRYKHYPDTTFEPKTIADWEDVELVKAEEEFGYVLPKFLATSPYALNYTGGQNSIRVDCTIDPSLLCEELARMRNIVLDYMIANPQKLVRFDCNTLQAHELVQLAKQGKTNHRACLLMLTLPLWMNESGELSKFFFSEHPVTKRPPLPHCTKNANS
mmetsp:Transcript_17066/g.66478  ORF Transcript_17066/g.66478 Transcript_17066/m.66478 type:complete len:272 (-) Transcript_17066:45-860(-)